MVCFGSYAMDLARVQSAKAELQAATDAAARYAAGAMRSNNGSTSSAADNAAAVFAESRIDGIVVPFATSSNLEIGIWTPGNKSFAVTPLNAGANAVRLRTQFKFDQNRPLALAGALGQHVTVRASAIVMMNGTSGSTWVSAKGNPWLAGMPGGTVSNNWRANAPQVHDTAGPSPNSAMSPGMISLAAVQINSGATIMFDNVTGTANNTGGSGGFTADGNTGWIVSLGDSSAGSGYLNKPMNGISNIRAPINAMIAVFLNDNAPNTTAAPAALDFQSTAQRDYVSLAPALKQTFFIGNGRRSTGEVQQIVVPPGATRLFIGNMDAWQWNDNTGGYNATINSTASVTTVQ
jgi:hypothetical protein